MNAKHLDKKRKLIQESIFISLGNADKIHIKRIYTDKNGPPVLALHGLMSNGKVFYTKSGKGLSPYLAQNGFDVFVPDLRGVGESTPSINKHSRYGQTDAITQEIPLIVNKINELKNNMPQHWLAHSWGGILLLCSYLRSEEFQNHVQSMTFLASRRNVRDFHLKKSFGVKFLLFIFSYWLCRFFGYWPVKKLKLGQENNTAKMYQQSMSWFRSKEWKDSVDLFDYQKALQHIPLPFIQSFSGSLDNMAGDKVDVDRFLKEINCKTENIFIGKKQGFQADYDHISLLTSPDAVKDHFPLILKGIKSMQYEKDQT